MLSGEGIEPMQTQVQPWDHMACGHNWESPPSTAKQGPKSESHRISKPLEMDLFF